MQTSALAAFIEARRVRFAGGPIKLKQLAQLVKLPPETIEAETIDEAALTPIAKFLKMTVDSLCFEVAAHVGPDAISREPVAPDVAPEAVDTPPVLTPQQRYVQIATLIIERRHKDADTAGDDEEKAHMAQLDLAWQAMTSNEQQEAEKHVNDVIAKYDPGHGDPEISVTTSDVGQGDETPPSAA